MRENKKKTMKEKETTKRGPSPTRGPDNYQMKQ